MNALTVAAAALTVPCLALADFEGVLDSKMTGDDASGTMRWFVSKAGIRNEMDMSVPEAEKHGMGKAFKMVLIVKSSEPNVTYLIDDSRKAYSVLEHKPGSKALQDRQYTVKKTGKDKVAGFACDAATVTDSNGHETELCVTSDILGGSDWMRAFQQRAQEQGDGLQTALVKAGVKGFPVRWVSKGTGHHGGMTMELVSAQRQSVPASMFEVPAGYTKSEHMMPGMTPEMEKKMEEATRRQQEALEKMPPEQRKQIEEMMKKFGGGAPR